MPDKRKTGLLFPFSSKMEVLLKTPCFVIHPSNSIAAAARMMKNEHVGALVIQESGSPIGIVTESDLVQKALASEMLTNEPVSLVMSPKIITVQKEQPIFDGLMLMINHGVRHLLVLDDENLAGIVSEHDWITFQRRHPVVAIHDIAKATSFEEIGQLRSQASNLAYKIFEQEGNAVALATLFSEINDRVTTRVIEIALENIKAKGLGDPPAPFCWIGMGSEGRKAQTISTDQDNGIIYDNVPEKAEEFTKNWFLNLAENVVNGLEVSGFPKCRGNIMATNPELCCSIDSWKKLFANLMAEVDPSRLLKASIYFDFRAIYGESNLADQLWDSLIRRINLNKSFLRHMGGNMVTANRPPIDTIRWRVRSLFRLSPPIFDIKRQALSPLVDAARILALHCNSKSTNTLERLEIAEEKGIMDSQILEAAKDAYNFIMLLRIRHEISDSKRNSTRFNPKSLNPLQNEFLKDTLENVYRLQSRTFFLIGGVDL